MSGCCRVRYTHVKIVLTQDDGTENVFLDQDAEGVSGTIDFGYGKTNLAGSVTTIPYVDGSFLATVSCLPRPGAEYEAQMEELKRLADLRRNEDLLATARRPTKRRRPGRGPTRKTPRR